MNSIDTSTNFSQCYSWSPLFIYFLFLGFGVESNKLIHLLILQVSFFIFLFAFLVKFLYPLYFVEVILIIKALSTPTQLRWINLPLKKFGFLKKKKKKSKQMSFTSLLSKLWVKLMCDTNVTIKADKNNS